MQGQQVPMLVHEAAMARMERTVRRLWLALITALIVLAVTVGALVGLCTKKQDCSPRPSATPLASEGGLGRAGPDG